MLQLLRAGTLPTMKVTFPPLSICFSHLRDFDEILVTFLDRCT